MPIMGWRGDARREEWEKERERQFVESLSRSDRLRLRLWQACGTGILVCLIAILMTYVFSSRLN
jgi:hypothetical protein